MRIENSVCEIDLPVNTCELYMDLVHSPSIYIKDFEVTTNSDFEKALLKLAVPNLSVYKLNRVLYLLKHTDFEILEAIENDVLYEQYSSLEDIIEDIYKLKKEEAKLVKTYFMPLTIRTEYGENIPNIDFSSYEEEIKKELEKEKTSDLNDLTTYFNNQTAREKIIMSDWDVAIHNGVLFGCVKTYLKKDFTEEEEKQYVCFLEAQAADGFGEGFEQREISVPDTKIFVSFWNSRSWWKIETE